MLKTDRLNLYGKLSSLHNTWPFILSIYNLPLWLCQKLRNLLLTMLISRLKQPSFDIDVFLEPFMDDMKVLWEGVEIIDGSLRKKFTLKAIIFVSITDYAGLFSLSGHIKGKTGCIVCLDGTYYA
jgi:hypothetical protein